MNRTESDEDLIKKARELCDLRMCASMGEAKRIVVGGGYNKVKAKYEEIQKKIDEVFAKHRKPLDRW
jgi:hypothetical protein